MWGVNSICYGNPSAEYNDYIFLAKLLDLSIWSLVVYGMMYE